MSPIYQNKSFEILKDCLTRTKGWKRTNLLWVLVVLNCNFCLRGDYQTFLPLHVFGDVHWAPLSLNNTQSPIGNLPVIAEGRQFLLCPYMAIFQQSSSVHNTFLYSLHLVLMMQWFIRYIHCIFQDRDLSRNCFPLTCFAIHSVRAGTPKKQQILCTAPAVNMFSF